MKVLLASDGSAAAMNAARFLNQLKFDGKLKLTAPHRFCAAGADHSWQHPESGMGGTGKGIRC